MMEIIWFMNQKKMMEIIWFMNQNDNCSEFTFVLAKLNNKGRRCRVDVRVITDTAHIV